MSTSYVNVTVAARELLWNDGEGVTLDDLNLMQRLGKKDALDFLAPALCRGATGANLELAGDDTANLWAPPGHASPDAGPVGSAVAMTSSNHAGWIYFQSSTGLAATDYNGRAVYVADDDLLTLHDAADPSQDRYDLIALKLDITSTDADGNPTSETRDFEDATSHALSSVTLIKRRKVTLSKSVTKGTPGAGVPATPSGYIPWAVVKIPATFSGTIVPSTQITDYRMVIGSWGQYVVPAYLSFYDSGWVLQSSGYLKASAGGHYAYFHCPPIAQGRRVLNLRTLGVSGSTQVDIIRRDLTAEPVIDSPLVTNAGINYSPSSPLWLNTYPSERAGGNYSLWARIKSNAANDTVTGVVWTIG